MASKEILEMNEKRRESGEVLDGGTLAGTVIISGDKISTLIPRRIFVGGFPAETCEEELRVFFEGLGRVKDVKIIIDKGGQAKGNYGFVTFESHDVAERIITEQAESLVFKDRKLNIGRAVKKQPLTAKSELQNTFLFNPLSMAYNPMYSYQDYSYLLNQDLSGLYQNYAAMIPQLPMLSSLFSPLMGGSDSLGVSLSQYAQIQSLLPFSLNSSYPSLSSVTPPLSENNPACLTDPYSISALLSTSNDLSISKLTDSLKTCDSFIKANTCLENTATGDIKSECKTSPKVPFTAITNKYRDISEDADAPKKKMKYDESVTCSAAPIRYNLPNRH